MDKVLNDAKSASELISKCLKVVPLCVCYNEPATRIIFGEPLCNNHNYTDPRNLTDLEW